MKKKLTIISALILFACSGSSYEYFDGTFEEAKAIAGSKLIFVKFYTNTWAGCIRLDVETLRNPEVQAFSSEHFISLKYNAKDEVGNQLYKQYNCQYVPHMLFLDSNGNEVDRIIGFLPPTEYLLRINDIVNKRNTLDDYLRRYKKGEISSEILASIATKYEDRKDNDKAAKFYSMLIENFPNESSKFYNDGKFFLATHEFKNGNEKSLKNYIKKNPESEHIFDAYRKMTHHYANTKEIAKELAIFQEMLIAFPENASALNSYAWRMAEIDTNLEDALIKARKGVALTADNPKKQAGIIDTEAEVLWRLERYDEAIEVIERAISIEPENEYFKDQKEKFIESKNSSDNWLY